MMFSIFHYSFIQNAFLAGTVVAVVAGAVGYFLVTRGLTFAGHALSHIGFAGAAAALLIGVDPIFGMLAFTILAGAGIGIFGKELREEDVNIGIVMTLALGLGALFIALYNGYAEQAYSIFRPLLFSSIDPEVAEARGVPIRFLGILFLVLVAVAVSMSVQVVGVLLIFTLLVGPAATATRIVHNPLGAVAASIAFALAFTWLGIFLAATGSFPVTFYIATISFVVYLPVRLLTAHT
jgi:zinc/manganese transport system permease protein